MTDRGAIDRLLVLAKELGNHLGPGAGDARPPRSLAVLGEYRPGVEGARRSGLPRMEHDDRCADIAAEIASCPVHRRQAEISVSVLEGQFRRPPHGLTRMGPPRQALPPLGSGPANYGRPLSRHNNQSEMPFFKRRIDGRSGHNRRRSKPPHECGNKNIERRLSRPRRDRKAKPDLGT